MPFVDLQSAWTTNDADRFLDSTWRKCFEICFVARKDTLMTVLGVVKELNSWACDVAFPAGSLDSRAFLSSS